MDAFTKELNELLVNTFWSILKVEEKMLKHDHNINLSINEFHLIETVGNGDAQGITVGDIAQKLQIAPPSVTVSINKLRTKGYVEKRRDERDGRVVYVTLTDLGHKINRIHQYFHARMVGEVVQELSPEERDVLLSGLRKLSGFFSRRSSGAAEGGARATAGQAPAPSGHGATPAHGTSRADNSSPANSAAHAPATEPAAAAAAAEGLA